MTRVLVTGGTGSLGRELVPRLAKAGYTVRVMSRRSGESNAAGDVEWTQADLRTGAGVADAVRDVDIIHHAASSPFKDTAKTDVDGTRLLLDAAKAAGVKNVYYISIVGVDKIHYAYYDAKLAAEKVVEESGAPYTILRATQFHPLLDTFLSALFKRGPFLFLPPNISFQLLDIGEVADHMMATTSEVPGGRLADVGGPEVLTLQEIAREWKKARGGFIITVPVPGFGPAKAMAGGANCCPDSRIGKVTWREWLAGRYPRS